MKPILIMNNFALVLLLISLVSKINTADKGEKNSSYIPDLQEVKPLKKGHAHNDYQHDYPLFDALELGFNYIETDVHFINDQLYISHLPPLFPDKDRTLSKLYLEPLFNIQQVNQGSIFPKSNSPLILMIDIKSEAISTYEKLKEVLRPFHSMLCHWKNNVIHPGALQIIISGNRPISTIMKEEIRYVQVDGRIKDLPQHYPTELMPIISDNYSNVFGYSFFRNFPSKNKLLKLRSITEAVHAQDKIIRLWNSPENEETWEQLIYYGVDLINTDSLQKLNTFLEKKNHLNPALVENQ